MVKNIKILFIAMLIFAGGLNAQSVKAEARLDSSKFLIGDFIHYHLKIERDKNVTIIPFSVQDSIKNIELVKAIPPKSEEKNGRITDYYEFVFAGYDSLDGEINQLRIFYTTAGDTARNSVYVNAIPISVKKVEVNRQADIKDIKEPYTIPFDYLLLFIIILAVAVIGTIGYYFYRKYKAKKEAAGQEVIIIKTPYEEAFDSLKELEDKKLFQKGYVKEYHTELTYIIRRYFERLHQIPALEITSYELLESLKSINIPVEVQFELTEFFNNADMVKFAKFQPMNSINEKMLQIAYKILEVSKEYSAVKEENITEVENVQ